MRTHFIEASNGPQNYGKFMLQQFTVEENTMRSQLPGWEHQTLRNACGWSSTSIWVLDLQTGEGARFEGHGVARYDLSQHKIWVCPLFEPFLTWLYDQDLQDITKLPRHIDLPEAPAAFRGYRRPGGVSPTVGCLFEIVAGEHEGWRGELTSVTGLRGVVAGKERSLDPTQLLLYSRGA